MEDQRRVVHRLSADNAKLIHQVCERREGGREGGRGKGTGKEKGKGRGLKEGGRGVK